MILIDSSGWLEFFTDGPVAEAYEPFLVDLGDIVTPTVVLYEVYKWVKRERNAEDALTVVSQLEKTLVAPLTSTIALTAADLSIEHRIAMADALVYASARAYGAQLVTSDSDFASLPGVTYLEKP